jgi:hypothetical protein
MSEIDSYVNGLEISVEEFESSILVDKNKEFLDGLKESFEKL